MNKCCKETVQNNYTRLCNNVCRLRVLSFCRSGIFVMTSGPGIGPVSRCAKNFNVALLTVQPRKNISHVLLIRFCTSDADECY